MDDCVHKTLIQISNSKINLTKCDREEPYNFGHGLMNYGNGEILCSLHRELSSIL